MRTGRVRMHQIIPETVKSKFLEASIPIHFDTIDLNLMNLDSKRLPTMLEKSSAPKSVFGTNHL